MSDILDTIGNSISQAASSAANVVRGSLSSEAQGFSAGASLPSSSGNQLRQSKISSLRTANIVRNMVRFFLPELGIVEMYVNPQSIKYGDKKHIPAPTRTRGGYLIQYWGEELGTLSISGTTGSSGVEGINVLYDVYRNEQVAMDALALAVEASKDAQSSTNMLDSVLGSGNSLTGIGKSIGVGIDSLFDQVTNVIQTGSIDPNTPKPTLASIAFQTEIYWSGWVFRGYFTSMTVTEAAEKLGLFDYSMEFVVTQKRGLRLNFLPWHRSSTEGPSNSDPSFGPSYSYSTLANPIPQQNLNEGNITALQNQTRGIDALLQSGRPL
jgi:hypothetical protein